MTLSQSSTHQMRFRLPHLNLSISALGNVRTLRAFSAKEMMTVVSKML
jgi:uncharacterized protein with GYD domain